ncbi:MAG: DUF2249 domain-containing protein [Alphaproteobacteria bacterium]|nr:DUF2249 domain-containing protein [Alphaproteobacteria bacterium]
MTRSGKRHRRDLDALDAWDAPPDWVADVDSRPVALIDVPALLDASVDPFPILTAAADAVGTGEGMVVLAPFDPIPLRDMLTERGFSNWGMLDPDGRWRVRFYRAGACGGDGPAARKCPHCDHRPACLRRANARPDYLASLETI